MWNRYIEQFYSFLWRVESRKSHAGVKEVYVWGQRTLVLTPCVIFCTFSRTPWDCWRAGIDVGSFDGFVTVAVTELSMMNQLTDGLFILVGMWMLIISLVEGIGRIWKWVFLWVFICVFNFETGSSHNWDSSAKEGPLCNIGLCVWLREKNLLFSDEYLIFLERLVFYIPTKIIVFFLWVFLSDRVFKILMSSEEIWP